MKTNWAERFIQGVFDAYAPLKRLGRKEYILARMVKSADASLEATLLYGKPRIDSDGVIHGTLDGKGFIGHMQDLNGEHDRFFHWVAGNRAGRLMDEGRENLFSKENIAALKRLNEGKMNDGSSRKQAYAKALEALNSYNKAVLDIAEKTGLIDGESRKTWEHDFYVPFFRVNDDMTIEGPSKVKGLARQKAFEKLKGGKENLGDLLDNTMRNWSHLLSASLANQAALANLKAAARVGIATEVPESAAKDMVKSAGVGGATFAMDGGTKHWYIVDDAQVLEAISAMESAAFKHWAMKLMGEFKHYLTLGVTVSPTFRIRNLMRDSISAIAQNDLSYNVAGNVWRGYKAMDRKGEAYAQALFSGALLRFGQLTDGKHAEHAKRLILSGVDDQTILDTPQKVKDAVGKMWDWWQETGDTAENVNRMSRYMQGLARGEGALEAAFAARDMMDFSLQGSSKAVRSLTQIVPFMNARLQGMYKLGRAAKEDPARLGYVVGAVALASIALLLAYKDDDEWKKREDWDRDNFWWFRIGNAAFRIPKPFEIGAMGTLAERSVELAISDEMTGKRFAERLSAMLGGTFALNPTPQLFKPMIDIYANKDSFTGRLIESRGLENLTKPERSTPNTSLVAKTLGKAGDVTQLSPVQIDFLIRSYFGWLGSHAAMTVDLMSEPFMDVVKPARRLEDIFVLGDFVKGLPNNRSRYVEDFYKQAKVVHEVMGDLKRAREVGDIEKVRSIMEERRDDIALSRLYIGIGNKIGEVNKRIRIVQGGNLPAEIKRQRLDELEALRARMAEQAEKIRASRRAAKRSPALSE